MGLCFDCIEECGSTRPAGTAQWEYATERIWRDKVWDEKRMDTWLCSWGMDGWELVQIDSEDGEGGRLAIFKRRKE